MAISKVGTAFVKGDAAAVASRTVALPTGISTNDVIYMEITGGGSTWTHIVSSTGVTWTQEGSIIPVSGGGMLSSFWRGFVTSGATASGATVTITTQDATPVATSTKLSIEGQVYRGQNTGGTNGSAGTHSITPSISTVTTSSVTTPFAPATTVAGCVLVSAGKGARSAVPTLAGATYEGGTADASTGTAGTSSLHGGGFHTDLAPITLGATPGGKTFAFYDETAASNTGNIRAAWTLVIEPSPVAPTVTAAIDQTDPAAGVTLTLSGTVTGTATSRLWRVVSGPASPSITNSTTNTATVVPTVPGTYVFGFTATNATGTSTEQTVTAYVHPIDGADVPVVSVSLPAAWTVFPSGTALANVTDTDPTTGIQNATGTPSHTDKAVITFAPMGPGNITFDLYSFYVTTGVTGRAIVYKPDGTTQVYPASGGDDWTPTTTEALHTVTLDSTALAALSTVDRRALVVKISAQ